MKNRRYVNSYASTAAIINLQGQIDDIKASGSGAGNTATWAQVNNTDLIPDSKISETFAKAADLSTKADLVDGKVPVEQLPASTVGIVVGEGDNDAFAGSRGVALETKVTDLEATVSDKLGVDDVAVWAKSEDPTPIPVNKLDDHAVKYSDFSYVPGGESDPVERKTIQLANYDSISGMNVAGNDAANLIMMSKWDKVDIGSSRYPVNLNGSEFTLNDNRDIAKVYETNGLTDLSEGESDSNIRSALGLEFDKLIEIIQDKDVVIVDRNSAGDYKTCIHATGNISSGNGGANLMFFIGTTPTIYQVQYVSGTYALAVIKYEFADKDDIPTDVVSHDELANYPTKEEMDTTVNGVMESIPDTSGFATKEEVAADIANLVPNTRAVAGKALDSDITIASSDLTDGDKLAFVYELNGLTNLQEGAGEDAIKAALGIEFEELITIIQEGKTVIVDRNNAGDYKACIHASGNISGGNGGANLMFLIGSKPTIFQIQYVSGIYALAVIQSEFATTEDVSDSIEAEASARDKAIETATSDLVHNTLTVAGKSLTENITLASTDLTDGEDLAKTSDVSDLDTKVFGDLDVSKFENATLTCQVVKLDSSYTGDLGLPENINGQPYNEETNSVNPLLDYLVCGYFDEGFVFHYDAWDAMRSSAIFKTIISALGLTNTSVDNKVAKTTRVAGHELNADVELASTDLTDGDELARKDEILNTVVDESRNETLRQSLTARTYLPVQRSTDVTNKPEAEIFSEYFNASVTDRSTLKTYLQSNMAYISYNFILSGNCTFYKLPIVMADIPNTGDITIVAVGPDINNSNLFTKFTFVITLNGDASSVHMEKKALES